MEPRSSFSPVHSLDSRELDQGDSVDSTPGERILCTNAANETHPDRTLKLDKCYPQIAQIHVDKTENHRRKSASSADGMFWSLHRQGSRVHYINDDGIKKSEREVRVLREVFFSLPLFVFIFFIFYFLKFLW